VKSKHRDDRPHGGHDFRGGGGRQEVKEVSRFLDRFFSASM